MAGKPRTLSPAQQVSVDRVKAAAKAYRDGKAETEARIRAAVAEENKQLEMDYALAIRRSHDIKTPISRIGTDGMGTADHNTVKRWLAKTDRMNRGLASTVSPAGAITWTDKANGELRVKYEFFPTTIVAEDYPELLEGVARMDSNSETGWAVVSDPGTVDTELGELPGWFTVELTDVSSTIDGSLSSVLNQWVEENR